MKKCVEICVMLFQVYSFVFEMACQIGLYILQSLRLRDHIDRPVTPNPHPSLIGRAPTSKTIFNARDGVSPLQVKHRNCNLCCLLIWFFFFFFLLLPKPYRFGYVLYKSLPLGPVIQKFCRSPPVSCSIKLEKKKKICMELEFMELEFHIKRCYRTIKMYL